MRWSSASVSLHPHKSDSKWILSRLYWKKWKMKPNKRKQEFWFHVPYWRQNHKIAVWFESLSVTTTTENLCSIGIFAHCKSAIFISLSLSHTIQLNLNFKSSFLFSHRKYFNLKNRRKRKCSSTCSDFPIFSIRDFVYAPAWCEGWQWNLFLESSHRQMGANRRSFSLSRSHLLSVGI